MKKFTITTILTIFLVIPIFFGVYTEFFLAGELELYVILSLLLGFFLLLLIGWVINSFSFNETDIELMRNQNVVKALINDNNINLWFFFPITMIMEELIFRYYILSFLALTLQIEIVMSILISSLAFSI